MLPGPLFLNIHMYGIMIVIGILFAYFILFFLTKKKNRLIHNLPILYFTAVLYPLP